MQEFTRRARAALAELLIIVAGVLIALGVDSWWSRLQDRSTEREYLTAIARDLRTDLAEFEVVREVLQNSVGHSNTTVEFVLAASEGSGSDGLGAAMYCASFLPVPVISRATLEDLLSTGALQLLETRSVRGAILDYHGRVEAELQWVDEYRASQAAYRASLAGLGMPYLFAQVGGPASVPAHTAEGLLSRLAAQPETVETLNRMLFAQQRMLVHVNRLVAHANGLVPVVEAEIVRLGGQVAEESPSEVPSEYMLRNTQCFAGDAP